MWKQQSRDDSAGRLTQHTQAMALRVVGQHRGSITLDLNTATVLDLKTAVSRDSGLAVCGLKLLAGAEFLRMPLESHVDARVLHSQQQWWLSSACSANGDAELAHSTGLEGIRDAFLYGSKFYFCAFQVHARSTATAEYFCAHST